VLRLCSYTLGARLVLFAADLCAGLRQGPACVRHTLCSSQWGFYALVILALASTTGVSHATANSVHVAATPPLKTAKPSPFGAAFDAARVAAAAPRGSEASDAQLQILRREQHGTTLQWLDAKKAAVCEDDTPDKRPSPFFGLAEGDVKDNYNIVSYSPDGRLLARVQTSEASAGVQPSRSIVSIIDTSSGQEVLSVQGHSPEDTIQGVAFSPAGTYLVVCSRFRLPHADTSPSVWKVKSHDADGNLAQEADVATGKDGEARNNLVMWHVGSGRVSGAWSTHIHWDPDRWPYVQWQADEMLGAWALPGALMVFRALSSSPTLVNAARLALTNSEPCNFAVAPMRPKDLLKYPHPQPALLKLAVFMQESDADRIEIVELAGKSLDDDGEEEALHHASEHQDSWTTLTTLPMPGAGTYIFEDVCMYVCMCVYVCMCMFVCVCVYVCMHVCMHVYTHNFDRDYHIYVCMCVCMTIMVLLHRGCVTKVVFGCHVAARSQHHPCRRQGS
jgi:hypothetical protein